MVTKERSKIESAITRLKRFKVWFSKIDDKNVCLRSWISRRNGDPIKNPSRATIERCGGTACLGGWLVLSPMYRTYREEKGLSTSAAFMRNVSTSIDRHLQAMFRFVGSDIVYGSYYMQSCTMFSGGHVHSTNNKKEAIARLATRIERLEVLLTR